MRYRLALLAALGALAVQQATTAAAAPSYQAVPAAQTSATTAPPARTASGIRTAPVSAPVVTAPPTTAPPATAPPTTAPPATAPPAQHLTATNRPSTPAPTHAAVTPPSGYGCGPALAYLSAHAAPGFRFECPGYALGHQAMTCINVSGVCSGEKLIVINVPCQAAYMNEASNSWSMQGLSNAPIDPYGYCH